MLRNTYVVRIPKAHADEFVLRSAEAVLVNISRHHFVRAPTVFIQSEVGLQIFGRRGARVVGRRQVRVGRHFARVLQELEIARRACHPKAAKIFGLEIARKVCNDIKINFFAAIVRCFSSHGSGNGYAASGINGHCSSFFTHSSSSAKYPSPLGSPLVTCIETYSFKREYG